MLRRQPGTAELPPTCLGEVGHTVVPWRRREGIATAALRQMLVVAGEVGLPCADLTADGDNAGSQRVIRSNGGELVETFIKPPEYGESCEALLFRTRLPQPGAR